MKAMFNSYEMTRAFVAERQATLRHEARQHRLGRGVRKARRPSDEAPIVRLASPPGPSLEDRQAA